MCMLATENVPEMVPYTVSSNRAGASSFAVVKPKNWTAQLKQKYVLHTFLVCFSSLHRAYHFLVCYEY